MAANISAFISESYNGTLLYLQDVYRIVKQIDNMISLMTLQ